MNPVQKALWYVESHSRSGINLDDVADASGVSQYHLTRAFSEFFGVSVMRYARRRRLTEAAKQLASGASDILAIAVDNGYGSHEAFTRAFKEEFGVTPESVRMLGILSNLKLTEPIVMKTIPLPKLDPPRIEALPSLRLAGLVERYDCKSPAGIPNQWQRFLPYFCNIPGQVGKDAFGVCFNFDESGKFDYLTGVVVKKHDGSPFGLVQMDLPPQKYAVFSYGGHIASIRAVVSAIWSDALPNSGFEAVNGPTLEKYGPQFDPNTGNGGFEIWVTIK